jgi:parallel beta-helix repeat protein
VPGANNTIGGTTPAAGNVISGNNGNGIEASGSGSNGNQILGNKIGTYAAGTAGLPNGLNGVYVSGTSDTVGGTAPGAGNVIAFNLHDGVRVDTGTGNPILGNRIFGNTDLGIELVNGGNNGQAAPELTSAVSGRGETNFTGTMTGRPLTTYTLEFYADTVVDPSGSGQGERFLISVTVTTDASGVAQFAVSLGLEVPAGQYLTATATDPDGNTSMFGLCQQVAPA